MTATLALRDWRRFMTSHMSSLTPEIAVEGDMQTPHALHRSCQTYRLQGHHGDTNGHQRCTANAQSGRKWRLALLSASGDYPNQSESKFWTVIEAPEPKQSELHAKKKKHHSGDPNESLYFCSGAQWRSHCCSLNDRMEKEGKYRLYWDLRPQNVRAVGLDTIQPMEDFMAMGIVDVIKRLPQIIRAKRRGAPSIVQSGPLRYRCARLPLANPEPSQAKNITAVGIVSPQIWAWRRNRAAKIAQKMDQLLCLFDFEPELYPTDFDARFVGHPIQQWTQNATQSPPTSLPFSQVLGPKRSKDTSHCTLRPPINSDKNFRVPGLSFPCRTHLKHQPCPKE